MSLPFTNTTQVTNESLDEADYQEFYQTSQFITGLILYPLICFPGLIGNVLTLIVLSQRNMKTSTNVFLSALAVSDSLKLLNDILYFLVIVLMKTNPPAANKAYGYLYPYAHFIFNMAACVSSWLIISVATERYVLVCHPHRARVICSRMKSTITSVIVFVSMTALAIPAALRYKTITVFDNSTNTSSLDVQLTTLWKDELFVTIYIWIQNFLRSIIPLFVLIFLNLRIIQALRRTRASKKNAARNRVTFTMIVIIIVFTMCITPDAIMSTFIGVGYHEADYLAKGIREYTDTLLALNAAINFVIYCLLNKIFRGNFKKIFCRSTATVRSEVEMDESQTKRFSLYTNGVTKVDYSKLNRALSNVSNNNAQEKISGDSPTSPSVENVSS